MSKKAFIAKTCLKQLSSVEEKIRNKGLRSIQKHVASLEASDLTSISLGLYYFYWYSDKTSKQLKFLWDLRELLMNVANRDLDLFWVFLKELLETLAQKFVKIDVYRASKFLLLAKFLFHLMYGLDLESVLFDTNVVKEAKTLEIYEKIWDKKMMKTRVLEINKIVNEVLMECASRRGLLFQYIYTVRDLFKRLFKLKRFKMMKELFLFVKPLLNLTAFTWNKKMRLVLQSDFLEHLLKILIKRGYKARARFAKFVLVYAKSPDLTELNRKIFYDFLDKVEVEKTPAVAEQKYNEDQNEENEMEKELKEMNKEFNLKESKKEVNKPSLDIKSLNIKQLVKRHYDKFTNEEVIDEDEDEDYLPGEEVDLDQVDLTMEACKMVESLATDKREEIVEEEEEEAEGEEDAIVISKKEKAKGTSENGKSVNGHGHGKGGDENEVNESSKVEENGEGGLKKEEKIFEMSMEEFNNFDLPELDVEEEDGEFIFGGNMSYEEMKNKLPEYYFKTPKQKKKYFRKLTAKYKKNLEKNSQGQIKRKKIRFDLSKNQKRFFKQKEIIKKS
jgi:hypothetical protein